MENQTLSLIQTLHARYERTWDEYTEIDRAHSAGHFQSMHLQNAMHTNNRESDALRQAILYQVPADDTDALILALHVEGTFNLTDAFHTDEEDVDRLAFETGLETLLDYLFDSAAGKVPPGQQMEMAEKRVKYKRQLRTGIVEALHG